MLSDNGPQSLAVSAITFCLGCMAGLMAVAGARRGEGTVALLGDPNRFGAALSTRLKSSVFITDFCRRACGCEALRRSSGNPFPFCLLAALCLPAPALRTTGALRYCCLINYVRGCKYKSLDTSRALFKRAALLREETVALIKRHTFISAACNGGFRSCQRRAADAGGDASQRPRRNHKCLIPFQLV